MVCSSRNKNRNRSNDFRRLGYYDLAFLKKHDFLNGYVFFLETSLQDDQNLSLRSVRIVVTVEFCLIAGKYCYETFATTSSTRLYLFPFLRAFNHEIAFMI